LEALGYLDSSVQRFGHPSHLFAHIRDVVQHGAPTGAETGQPTEGRQQEAPLKAT
jgi:hypothetical protein